MALDQGQRKTNRRYKEDSRGHLSLQYLLSVKKYRGKEKVEVKVKVKSQPRSVNCQAFLVRLYRGCVSFSYPGVQGSYLAALDFKWSRLVIESCQIRH